MASPVLKVEVVYRSRPRRHWLRRFVQLCPLTFALLWQVPTWNAAAAGPPALPSGPSSAVSAPPLNLEGCIALALQKQPSVAVGHASLAAATDAQRALDCLRFPANLVHELPIRRHQAELGVTAATAGLTQDEQDVFYAVTRTYFTVVYAREQERLARSLVERLQTTHDLAARMLKEGARDVADSDVDRSSIYLDLAETRRMQATAGVPRALAALREAVGTGACVEFTITDDHLPKPDARPCREQILSLALERRGDLILANTFAEIAALEVEAQKSSTHQRMETFAIGGDIHARAVPAGEHNHDYRPGALPPEMPAVLVGCKAERVARACSLSQRAAAAVVKDARTDHTRSRGRLLSLGGVQSESGACEAGRRYRR